MANKLQVRICGQEYTLVSENSREYMLETADYVDRKMVAVKNMNNRLSTSMVAILVALNVTDDMRQEKGKADEIINSQKAEIAFLKKKIEELEKNIPTNAERAGSMRPRQESTQNRQFPPR